MMVSAQQQKVGQNPQPKRISWEAFEKKYLTREDKYKYEWLDGIVEKTERVMNQSQLYIQINLFNFLQKLKTEGKADGMLTVEPDTFFLKNHRKPDIAHFSLEQIRRAKEGENQVPKFIIEVISKTDNVNRINAKVENYFAAGVQVIWHIFPENQLVHVYENSKRIMVCREEDKCSADSVIPGFILSVNDIFKTP